MRDMPVESRRSASPIRLMGMVVYREEFATEAIPRFSMAGGRSGNQMWNLDGGVVQNMTLRDLRLIDPASRQPFPDNVIPASRIDPIGQAFARFYPAPNTPDNDVTRAPRDNYVVNVSDGVRQDFYTARLDHNFSSNDRAYVRYSLMKASSRDAPVFPTEFADFRARTQDNDNTSLIGNWIRNVKPTLINEARFNYGNRLNIVRAAGGGSGKNGEIGVKGVDPKTFARVNVAGLSSLGPDSHERIQTPIYTFQFLDTVTWIRGRHQVKTGAEYRYSRNTDDNNAAVGGRFTFPSAPPATALPVFCSAGPRPVC